MLQVNIYQKGETLNLHSFIRKFIENWHQWKLFLNIFIHLIIVAYLLPNL